MCSFVRNVRHIIIYYFIAMLLSIMIMISVHNLDSGTYISEFLLLGLFFSVGKLEAAACFISHFSVLFLFRNLSL